MTDVYKGTLGTKEGKYILECKISLNGKQHDSFELVNSQQIEYQNMFAALKAYTIHFGSIKKDFILVMENKVLKASIIEKQKHAKENKN